MRRDSEIAESIVLLMAILASTLALSRMRAHAEDEPKASHGCPVCGDAGATFDDTPEGVFRKFVAAFVAGDVEMAQACVLEGSEDTWEGFRELQRGLGLAPLVRMRVVDCKADGDHATLTIGHPGEKPTLELEATHTDKGWRLDLGGDDWLLSLSARIMTTWAPAVTGQLEEARAKVKVKDCGNNLRQLGTYTIMYVSRYGGDRHYSGPGVKLLTDLFNLPTPKDSIARGGYSLLLCKANDETWDDARETALRKDDPGCTSYECIDTTISDATTQPDWPIAWDRKPHPDGTRNVLYFSGSVRERSEEEFQGDLKLWPHRK